MTHPILYGQRWLAGLAGWFPTDETHSAKHWILPTLIAVFFALQNPLLYGMAPAFDASLFATMGKMWADGGIIYRDMIDIKGPMIFLLDAIGYSIGGFRGIWLLETVLLVVALNALYRTLGLWHIRPISRLVGIMAWMLLYAYRYYYGNMTEDYTFSLALIAQYYFVRMIVRSQLDWRDLLIPALTFGVIAMVRLNNTAIWCGYYLVLFLTWGIQKRWADMVKLAVSGLLGLWIVVMPFIIFFMQHQVLDAFWFYSFGIFFGNSYGNGHSVLVGLVGFLRSGMFLLIPAAAMLLRREAELREHAAWNTLLWCQVAGIAFAIVSNSVSGHVFEHYEILFFSTAILLLPMIVDKVSLHYKNCIDGVALLSILAWVAYLIGQHTLYTWTRFERPIPDLLQEMAVCTVIGLVVAMICVVVGRIWLASLHAVFGLIAIVILTVIFVGYPAYTGAHKGRPFDDKSHAMVSYIKAHTDPADTIWVDGITPQYYVWTDRSPASAYLFFDNVTPPYDVRLRMQQDIERHKPKFIIMKLPRMTDVLQGKAPVSTPSFKAYYEYIQANYEPVSPDLPRLYRLK
jgi:hypothetical protein